MTIVAAAPIRVRMSRIFEAALVYANVSPPEITSTDPIKVSCQSIAIASPRILLASRASLTDSEHGKCQMPPYATLGLAARKALPGPEQRKAYRFVHTRDGRVYPSVFYTTPNPPQRQGRLVVLPPGIRPPDSHASRHGQPSVRRKRQCDENSRNKHLEGVRLSSSSCGSRPTLLPGINARPSRLALPGPPWPHHHSRPGSKMKPKMLEESPGQGIGASLGTPPIRTARLN